MSVSLFRSWLLLIALDFASAAVRVHKVRRHFDFMLAEAGFPNFLVSLLWSIDTLGRRMRGSDFGLVNMRITVFKQQAFIVSNYGPVLVPSFGVVASHIVYPRPVGLILRL